jgi:hypothetical protein
MTINTFVATPRVIYACRGEGRVATEGRPYKLLLTTLFTELFPVCLPLRLQLVHEGYERR